MVRETPKENQEASVLCALRKRERCNDRVILIDQANLARPARRTDSLEELDVGGGVSTPLLWNVVFVINRLDRTDRLAGATIDALIRLDIEHSLTLIDAVNWAFFNARLVLEIDARLGDDVRHQILRSCGRYNSA
jgi:hypothetical protein